jgi:DNA processing protein
VVVVEAAERSGALITARLALEQNLDVYAVPGDIDRETSRGCNLLIRDGAYPLTDALELIEALGVRPASMDPVLGLAPGDSVSVDELVEGADDPSRMLEEIGRLELAGRVAVRDGFVRVLPGEGAVPP